MTHYTASYNHKFLVHYSTRPHFCEEPILSRRSILKTPNIGQGVAVSKIPKTLDATTSHLHLQQIEGESLDEEPLDVDRILCLKLSIDNTTQKSVKNLLSKVPAFQHPNFSTPLALRYSTCNAIDHFLRCDSPPHIPILRPMSPPIFLCERRLLSTAAPKAGLLRDFSEVKTVLAGPAEVDDKQFDIPRESLVIMDGWNAIITSSPTLPASEEASIEVQSEVDELWQPSLTPEDYSLSKDLFGAKLDLVEIPRNRRAGNDLHSGQRGMSFADFMMPLINEVPDEINNVISVVKDKPRDVSPSVLGQASTIFDPKNDPDPASEDMDDIDGCLSRVYRTVKGKDFASVILEEKVEEKDGWIMDVPFLPPPNERASSSRFQLLKDMKCVLASSIAAKNDGDSVTSALLGLNLEKVGGLRSLNIELPWRPFIPGVTGVPTLERAIDVDGPLYADESVEVLNGIEGISDMGLKPPSSVPVVFNLDDEMGHVHKELDASLQQEPLLLTRLELDQLAGRNGRLRVISSANHPQGSSSNDNDTPMEDREYNPTDFQEHEVQTGDFPSPDRLASKFPSRHLDQIFPSTQDGPLFDHDEQDTQEPPHKIRRLGSPQLSTGAAPDTAPKHDIQSQQEEQFNPSTKIGGSTSAKTRSARVCLQEFMGMRGKVVPVEFDIPLPDPIHEPMRLTPHKKTGEVHVQQRLPEELLPYTAFSLPSPGQIDPSCYSAKFIASFDLIQKRGIFHHLSDPTTCAVEIIERTSLEDVDMLLSADAATIFYVLAGLPVDNAGIVEKICRISWRFSRILIIFEAYSPSRSKTVHTERDSTRQIDKEASPLSLNVFSPPVLKAFRQLRRSLLISESATVNPKNPACVVEFVFALNEKEAALYVRAFGDRIVQEEETWRASNSSSGVNGAYGATMLLDRSWLVDDEYEGERELAAFEGMNVFAAAAMLSQVNIQSLVDEMTPQERIEYFSDAIGLNRVVKFNETIETRMQALLSSQTLDQFSNEVDDIDVQMGFDDFTGSP